MTDCLEAALTDGYTIHRERGRRPQEVPIRDKITEVHDAVRVIRSVTEQVQDRRVRLADHNSEGSIGERADVICDKLTSLESRLLGESGSISTPHPTHANDFGWLRAMVSSADAQPTDQSYELFEDLDNELAERLGELDRVLATDLPAFNTLVQEQGLPAVILP